MLVESQANFNEKFDEYRRHWGGGIMGVKSQAKTKIRERILAKEAAQRAALVLLDSVLFYHGTR